MSLGLDLGQAPEGVNVPAGLQEAFDAAIASCAKLDVLEAGCGSASQLQFPANSRLTGIDLSRQQLERNHALDRRIAGDLQSHPLERGSYNVVVCWNVLEHLERPRQALDNMIRALQLNGVIVLALPNRYSVKGWLTKLTPHFFHIWIYRIVFGIDAAGRDDHGPFRTYFASPATPRGLVNYSSGHGLKVVYCEWLEDYGQRVLRERLRLNGRVWRELARIVLRLTRAKVDLDRTDVFMILKKEVDLERGTALETRTAQNSKVGERP